MQTGPDKSYEFAFLDILNFASFGDSMILKPVGKQVEDGFIVGNNPCLVLKENRQYMLMQIQKYLSGEFKRGTLAFIEKYSDTSRFTASKFTRAVITFGEDGKVTIELNSRVDARVQPDLVKIVIALNSKDLPKTQRGWEYTVNLSIKGPNGIAHTLAVLEKIPSQEK